MTNDGYGFAGDGASGRSGPPPDEPDLTTLGARHVPSAIAHTPSGHLELSCLCGWRGDEDGSGWWPHILEDPETVRAIGRARDYRRDPVVAAAYPPSDEELAASLFTP